MNDDDTLAVCCHHGQVSGCLGTPDAMYTMGETGWCASCGPAAWERRRVIERLLDLGYAPALERALETVAPQN